MESSLYAPVEGLGQEWGWGSEHTGRQDAELWTGGPGEPWSPGESPVDREMDELCQSEPSLVMTLLGDDSPWAATLKTRHS